MVISEIVLKFLDPFQIDTRCALTSKFIISSSQSKGRCSFKRMHVWPSWFLWTWARHTICPEMPTMPTMPPVEFGALLFWFVFAHATDKRNVEWQILNVNQFCRNWKLGLSLVLLYMVMQTLSLIVFSKHQTTDFFTWCVVAGKPLNSIQVWYLNSPGTFDWFVWKRRLWWCQDGTRWGCGFLEEHF